MVDIQVSHLTYTYPESLQPALRDASLDIREGAWVLLQGHTGSGKSTLLKCISGACPVFYGGTIQGKVSLGGHSVQELGPDRRVRMVGSVHQDPESQSVYATVGRDVAFSMENLGLPEADMRWRVAEALEMVGMSGCHDTSIHTLSGGQRQRVALAAALVHQPAILLLDEPSSQLDPVAAEELFDILQRLNQDHGLTIVMSEHRLDRAYTLVDQVVYMEGGRILQTASPSEMAAWLRASQPEFTPNLARLFPDRKVPVLTIREARAVLTESNAPNDEGLQRAGTTKPPLRGEPPLEGDPMLTIKHVDVAYEGSNACALNRCSATILPHRVTALIGANGAGKSTLLRVMAGMQSVMSGSFAGKLALRGRRHIDQSQIGYLPQNPGDFISQVTVLDELSYGLRLRGWAEERVSSAVQRALKEFALEAMQEMNPRDLSGGERLRVALAAATVHNPALLLLDEPTRGFDAAQKRRLGEWLRSHGMTAVVATHDMEFVGEFADKVLFLHQGHVVLSGLPRDVFRQALYFAPPIARALRTRVPDVVCLADAIAAGWAQ